MSLLSVIVPARNDGSLTRACLDALLQSLASLGVRCELILIDDASEPGEGLVGVFRDVRAMAPGVAVTIVRAQERRHYSGVFSLGLTLSKGEAIFFLSNDMWVTPSFIASLMTVAAKDPAFGIVRGTSNHTDAHPEHVVTPNPMPQHYGDVLAFSRHVQALNRDHWSEDRLLSGDAVLIKRAVVDAVGVMDLRFFGYFGDVDYGMRAHLAGFKLVCARGAWLYHVGGGHLAREGQLKGEPDLGPAHARRMAMVEAAYAEFVRKWGGDLPARYADLKSLEFFPFAEKRAADVPLKYELPEKALDGLAYF